jgi:lupus La protein
VSAQSLTSRGAYVEMKAKEKGIPQTEIQRGGGKDKSSAKWNAFREMNKIKSGGAPALAKIPDGVKVVGAPMGGQRERDNGKKRSRDDDDEEGASKRERVEVSIDCYLDLHQR